VGRAIQNAPCNGWEHWHYVEEDTGQRVPINTLRDLVRQQNARRDFVSGLAELAAG
jgi:hypothetical protein